MNNDPAYWPAPAKLNLFLHITGQRPDGFHELQTLFQILDWGDQLKVDVRSDGLVQRVNPIDGIPQDEDLTVRAARLLQSETGCRGGADIHLVKNIPLGSGLGGGSSDAATVLLALNAKWNCGLSTRDLSELGLRLGADVPVFVQGQSAWAEGVGEQLQAFEIPESWYVLVFPEIAVSSSKAFSQPQLVRNSPSIKPSEYSYFTTRNCFEPELLERYPVMLEVTKTLAQWGAPRLTGTGSCIFLPVIEKNDAIGITNLLKSRYNVRAVRGVNHSPVMAKLSEEC